MKLWTNKHIQYIYSSSVSNTLLLYEYINSNCTSLYSVTVSLFESKQTALHQIMFKLVGDWIKYKTTFNNYDKK